MLHSLPAVLDDLERRLMSGEAPLPLIRGIRWPDLVDWPKDLAEARRLKGRIQGLKALINGLQGPVRATLMAMCENPAYQATGRMAPLEGLTFRFQDSV